MWSICQNNPHPNIRIRMCISISGGIARRIRCCCLSTIHYRPMLWNILMGIIKNTGLISPMPRIRMGMYRFIVFCGGFFSCCGWMIFRGLIGSIWRVGIPGLWLLGWWNLLKIMGRLCRRIGLLMVAATLEHISPYISQINISHHFLKTNLIKNW